MRICAPHARMQNSFSISGKLELGDQVISLFTASCIQIYGFWAVCTPLQKINCFNWLFSSPPPDYLFGRVG